MVGAQSPKYWLAWPPGSPRGDLCCYLKCPKSGAWNPSSVRKVQTWQPLLPGEIPPCTYVHSPVHKCTPACACVCVSVWWNAGQRPGMTYAVCYWNFARMWKASRWKLRNASREWLLLIIYPNAAVRMCEWVMWFSVNRRRKWFFCSYLTSKSVARQPRISINVCVWTPFLICTYSHIHMYL